VKVAEQSGKPISQALENKLAKAASAAEEQAKDLLNRERPEDIAGLTARIQEASAIAQELRNEGTVRKLKAKIAELEHAKKLEEQRKVNELCLEFAKKIPQDPAETPTKDMHRCAVDDLSDWLKEAEGVKSPPEDLRKMMEKASSIIETRKHEGDSLLSSLIDPGLARQYRQRYERVNTEGRAGIDQFLRGFQDGLRGKMEARSHSNAISKFLDKPVMNSWTAFTG
jgi:hypothetical protein